MRLPCFYRYRCCRSAVIVAVVGDVLQHHSARTAASGYAQGVYTYRHVHNCLAVGGRGIPSIAGSAISPASLLTTSRLAAGSEATVPRPPNYPGMWRFRRRPSGS